MPSDFFNHEGEFVVVQNMYNRVVAVENQTEDFASVRIDRLDNKHNKWVEAFFWDEEEWRSKGTRAFEAILIAIARVMNNEKI